MPIQFKFNGLIETNLKYSGLVLQSLANRVLSFDKSKSGQMSVKNISKVGRFYREFLIRATKQDGTMKKKKNNNKNNQLWLKLIAGGHK